MDPLAEVRQLLTDSGDAGNPSAEQLSTLFQEVEKVGVIGISRFPEKAARRVPSYLAAKGYDIVPINPNAERILGRDAYDELADVQDELDMVVVFRPSAEAGRHVAEAMQRPENPAIWLQEGIFAEDEIARARAAGITAVQNLCAYRVHRALNE